MQEPATPTKPTPVSEATTADLAEALRTVLSDGLPLADEKVAPLLLNLRSVYARAVVPAEPASRLTALNELLPRLLAALSDATYRDAVQHLFGLAPGTRGTSLTTRRRQAAGLLGYNADHFRTNIEAKLLHAVALAVNQDLLRYRARVERASESLEATGDTPRLGPEHISHEEELISRIWQRVYELRAETIAVVRLSEVEGAEVELEEHRQAALTAEAALKRLISEYTDTYGERLVSHGDAEYAVDALARLRGWSA